MRDAGFSSEVGKSKARGYDPGFTLGLDRGGELRGNTLLIQPAED